MAERIPDWRLPQGVDRPLWEYLQSSSIADDYDRFFADTNLLNVDRDFLTRHFNAPGRLVDLGCGTGRLLVHFAKLGFDVTGVDLSQHMLRVCEEKSRQLNVSFTLLHSNLCDLAELHNESFDYAACMFSTIGMIVGQSRRHRALCEIHRILKPGGLLGLHVHNAGYNTWHAGGRRWLLRDLWRRATRHPEAGDKVQPQYRGIPNLRIHIFTPGELRRALKKAGFHVRIMLPLAADRAQPLPSPWLAPWLRANGWLVLAQRRDC